MVRLGSWVWRGRPQRWSVLSLHPIKATCCSSDLGLLVAVVCVRFGQGKVKSPFSYCTFGRKSRCLRIGQRCSISLGQSVDKLFGILHGRFVYSTPSIYFINNLRILVCTHGYLYYTLRYNPILCYLFCWWIVPALRLGVLSVGSCASLTQTSITVPLWGTALLSTIRCSSLTLYTPVPESAIPPRNESWLLFIGKWF